MSKKIMVISLGGSLIIPNEINLKLLKEFKKTILSNSKKYKFIIVTGGGSIARKYIYALRNVGGAEKLQSLSGISATRMNARFMSYFFNQDQEEGIPDTLKSVEKYIKNKDIVFCGGLEYKPNQTSDATSVSLAK
ncbi:MAG: UMP kinase, partial [bacterium]|nr:UMP kinase [bacterium]